MSSKYLNVFLEYVYVLFLSWQLSPLLSLSHWAQYTEFAQDLEKLYVCVVA